MKKTNCLRHLDQYFFAIVSTIVIMFSTQTSRAQESIPASIDLSSTKYFPPIGNQGYIAACDWFAVVYYQMTFLFNKQADRAASLDNTFSPKFGYNFLNNASIYPYNLRVDDVYKFVQKHGSATMSELPYDMAPGTGFMEWCTDADVWKNAINYRTNGYSYFTYKNTASKADYSFDDFSKYLFEIKRLLSEGEILVIQTNPFDTGKCLYREANDDKSTVEDDKYVGEHVLYSGNNGPDHTMAIVGYNDHIWVDLNNDGLVQPEEKGALKIADSYGLNYIPNRNDGFLWMMYSTVENSIFEHRVNRMNIRSNYKPKLTCKITLSTSQRDKLRFQFGRSDSNNSVTPNTNTFIFDPYGLGFSTGTAGVSLIEGGTCSFDGGTDANDGSFVFDLTDIYDKNSSQYWYLRISNSGTDTTIVKSFEIIDADNACLAKDNGLPYTLINGEVYRFASPVNTSTAAVSTDFVKNAKIVMNPGTSILTVSTGRSMTDWVVKIVNLQGIVLLSHTIHSETEFNLNMQRFSSGEYMVVLVDKNRLIRQSRRIFNK